MGIVSELKDEFHTLAHDRLPWERYWREIAAYVLPQTQQFDAMLSGQLAAPIAGVVNTPAAARRSRDLYDMTSLWAIERLTAGMISLKTPESQTWHDVTKASLFGEEETHEEKTALERLRNYLFTIRNAPRSGFWPAHRSAVRSMCAFGDGWMFVEEVDGQNARLPFRYQYMPLNELHPGVDYNGQPNRMFRLFVRTAAQLAQRFGDNLPESVKKAALDPKERAKTFPILHAVRPRDGTSRGRIGVRGAAFESHYLLPDDEYHIGESGFYEFPFTRYAWGNNGHSAYCEGPVACAIGELRSLQEMSKNELIAVQTAVRPAFAVHGKNNQRINLNPSAINQNLVSPEGRPLIQPLNNGVRPDFAQAIIEARRNSVRELLYLNLWQIIVQDRSETATEALIKAQEKGEMLGPVGISMNEGLATMVDREVGILGRKRAFDDDSPLAMPDSLANAETSATFTSPLDRLRRMSEIIGMQRLVEFATMLAGGDPNAAAQIMARFDIDEMLEKAQTVLGAPAAALKPREAGQEADAQASQMQQTQAALAAMQGMGEAARAVGEGAGAMAGGMEAASQSQGLRDALQNFNGMAQAGAQGAAQGAAAMGAA